VSSRLVLRSTAQIDVTLECLVRLPSIGATLAAFLAAAVKSRCNIIVTGGVNVGKTTFRLECTWPRTSI